jgi:hypothetical protein
LRKIISTASPRLPRQKKAKIEINKETINLFMIAAIMTKQIANVGPQAINARMARSLLLKIGELSFFV